MKLYLVQRFYLYKHGKYMFIKQFPRIRPLTLVIAQGSILFARLVASHQHLVFRNFDQLQTEK